MRDRDIVCPQCGSSVEIEFELGVVAFVCHTHGAMRSARVAAGVVREPMTAEEERFA